MRRMRAVVGMAVAASLAAACGGEATGPGSEITGVYTLVKIADAALPVVRPEFNGATVVGGTVTLFANDAYVASINVRATPGGPITSSNQGGTYSVSGSTLTVRGDDGTSVTGSIGGGKLSVTNEGVRFDFTWREGLHGAALDVLRESAHYTYRMAAGDQVDTTWQENYYQWVVSALAVTPTEKLEYDKYRDRAHMKALTGRETNGYADTDRVRFHTIWPTDNHECVHAIVTRWIGLPPALFAEGIAVAHQTNPKVGDLVPRWSGTAVDVLAARFIAEGRLPTLDQMIASTGFRQLDEGITYPASGSFVRYVIDVGGMAKIKTLFGRSTYADTPATFRASFLAVYGESIDTWWDRWKTEVARR